MNNIPPSVYLGSQMSIGYSLILSPVENDVRIKELFGYTGLNASRAAIKKAFDLYGMSPSSSEKVKGLTPVLSIVLSVPVMESPYTDAIPKNHLPPDANALVINLPIGTRYKIVVASVTWTARVVFLPLKQLHIPETTAVVSGANTYLGNKVYDFGCPHPSKSNIVIIEKKYEMGNPTKTRTAEKFRDEFNRYYKNHSDNMHREIMTKTFAELDAAIYSLPGCPPECVPGELSIMIGYPKPISVKLKESVVKFEKEDYVFDEEHHYKRVTTYLDRVIYTITGEWSWSVQRTCGSCHDIPVERKKEE